jgi:hypothetical protein
MPDVSPMSGEFMHIICAQIVNFHKVHEPAKMDALVQFNHWQGTRVAQEREREGTK